MKLTMTSNEQEHEAADAATRTHAEARPSLRLAFFVSLVVHTFFVFVMFRAYSELAGDKSPPIQIIARSRVPRPASLAVFASSPSNEAPLPDDTVRPAAPPRRIQAIFGQSAVRRSSASC